MNKNTLNVWKHFLFLKTEIEVLKLQPLHAKKHNWSISFSGVKTTPLSATKPTKNEHRGISTKTTAADSERTRWQRGLLLRQGYEEKENEIVQRGERECVKIEEEQKECCVLRDIASISFFFESFFFLRQMIQNDLLKTIIKCINYSHFYYLYSTTVIKLKVLKD